MTVEYVMPTPDQLKRLEAMIQRLHNSVVPTQEVRDLEDQVPSTYLNFYYVGGHGDRPYLDNHALDLSVPLERVHGGYTARK